MNGLLKGKSFQLRVAYTAELPFRNECEIKPSSAEGKERDPSPRYLAKPTCAQKRMHEGQSADTGNCPRLETTQMFLSRDTGKPGTARPRNGTRPAAHGGRSLMQTTPWLSLRGSGLSEGSQTRKGRFCCQGLEVGEGLDYRRKSYEVIFFGNFCVS